MKRNLMLVLLLLTGLALADQKPEQAASAVDAQKQSGTVTGQPEAQAKPKPSQKVSAAAQPKKIQGRAKEPTVDKDAMHEKRAEAQSQTKAAQPTAATQTDKKEEAQPASEDPQAQTDKDGKLTSVPGGKALGMSILGNQEAPKALVIVPWKSSDVGRAMGVSPMLDDSRQPVDKEVFMRELRYYEIKSQTKP